MYVVLTPLLALACFRIPVGGWTWVGVGLTAVGRQTYIWGVQYLNGFVYASDLVNGIWKLGAVRTIETNAAPACLISRPFLPSFGSLSQGALAAHQRTHEYALFPEVSRRSRDARNRAFRSPEAMGDIMHSEERVPF